MLSDTLLKKAIHHEKMRRKFILEEYQALMQLCGESINKTSFSNKDLYQLVRDRLQKDLKNYNQLYAQFGNNTKQLPWSLKTQKMTLEEVGVLEGTLIQLEANKHWIDDILKGELPLGIIEKLSKPKNLGENDSIITYFSSFMITLSMVLTKCEKISDLRIGIVNPNGKKEKPYYQKSVILHAEKSPIEFKSDCSYGFIQENECWISYIHSGYAFGGNEVDNQKKFMAPYDCSSFISELADMPCYSTYNFYDFYKQQVEGKTRMLKSVDYRPLENKFICLKGTTEDDMQMLKPGDVYVFRKFEKKQKDGLGDSGHTGIIVEVEKDVLKTIEYKREMPKFDGCGYNQVKKEDLLSPKSYCMFFRFYDKKNNSALEQKRALKY